MFANHVKQMDTVIAKYSSTKTRFNLAFTCHTLYIGTLLKRLHKSIIAEMLTKFRKDLQYIGSLRQEDIILTRSQIKKKKINNLISILSEIKYKKNGLKVLFCFVYEQIIC